MAAEPVDFSGLPADEGAMHARISAKAKKTHIAGGVRLR
jgi:hypothetical protein